MTSTTILLLPVLCVAAIVLMGLVAMIGTGGGTSAVMEERMQRRTDKAQQALAAAVPASRPASGNAAA